MFRAVSTFCAPIWSLLPTLTSLIPYSSCLKPDHPSFKLPIDPSSSFYSNPSLPASFIFFLPFSRSSRRKNEDESNDAFFDNKDPKSPHNLFVVQPRLRPDALLRANLSEALNLANSLEDQREWEFGCEFGGRDLPPHVVVQNPAVRSSRAHADTFFGPGTVETVKCHLNAVELEGRLDAIFVNTILSGIQQRNLERAWDKPVLDRVGLIIEIFNAHAETKEAKLQSELAALMYKRTRLIRIRGPDGRLTFGAAGEAEVVSARGRGSGGRGFISGAGETELQLQRRRILERRNRLLSQIEEVRRTRALQRAARQRHGGSQGQGLATVAVVGYTNAGKSTLVGALSESDLYSDSRLFATVDPKLRSVILPSGRKVLLSDTVGFISDLPVQLVEAFHATLEEVVEADLLVHVLDSSAFNLEEQRATVLHVLQQIGVSEEKLQNMIEVWNKIDLRDKDDGGGECLDEGEANDDTGSFSEAEEGDVVSELSQGDIIYKDMMTDLSSGEVSDGDDRVKVSSVDSDENAHGQLGMSSDGWIIEDERQDESSKYWKMIDDGTHSQPQDCQRVETSAVMGVGLQKLLELIDKKLSSQKVLERSSFDRKWRPPRSEDARTEVDQ